METLSLQILRDAEEIWGKDIESIKEEAPGIFLIETSRHGGYYLTPERNAEVPWYFKTRGTFAPNRKAGWYEEDCDASIVIVVFADQFDGRMVRAARENIQFDHAPEYERFLKDVG